MQEHGGEERLRALPVQDLGWDRPPLVYKPLERILAHA